MTLAQFDALVGVDVRVNSRAQAGNASREKRVWGNARDLKVLEARSG